MSITFIIGNGFDLNLGMKTRYSDVYEGYIKAPHTSNAIDKFKKELEDNYENWSDFEMGMAEYAKTLQTENELIECIRDFKGFLAEHLRKENEKLVERINAIQDERELAREIDRSLVQFYEGLVPNDRAKIEYVIKTNGSICNYITFNYTTALETILNIRSRRKGYSENAPIHIHGKLGEGIVLGVDNLSQLIATKYAVTKRAERAFVKTLFNKQFDMMKVGNAERTIKSSSIICIYGFAMGETDATWVGMIADWLLEDKSNQLIYFKHNTPEINTCNYDEIMDIEDDYKLEIMRKLHLEDESILEQIHIPIGRKIFNFNLKEFAFA